MASMATAIIMLQTSLVAFAAGASSPIGQMLRPIHLKERVHAIIRQRTADEDMDVPLRGDIGSANIHISSPSLNSRLSCCRR